MENTLKLAIMRENPFIEHMIGGIQDRLDERVSSPGSMNIEAPFIYPFTNQYSMINFMFSSHS